MNKISVSNIIGAVQAVEELLAGRVTKARGQFQQHRDEFNEQYARIENGIGQFVKNADSATLQNLTRAATQGKKAFDFEKMVAARHARNGEIESELKQVEWFFGTIASVQTKGLNGKTPNGLDAEQLRANAQKEIDERVKDPRIEKLGKVLIARKMFEEGNHNGQNAVMLQVDDAEKFLESCRNPGFFGYFKPSVWTGRKLNKLRDSGEYDAIGEIKETFACRRTLDALYHIEQLKDEYTDEGEMNTALRVKAMEVFVAGPRFAALAPIMGAAAFAPLNDAFARAVAEQETMNAMKPDLDRFESDVQAVKGDISILKKIKNMESSQKIAFDNAAYQPSIKDGKSAFTTGFKQILNNLEEEERRRRRAEEEARRRRNQSSSYGGGISIGGGSSGGGFGGFSGGGGSFGGGGASGSW